ncbi:VMAP-C domain-containing protein [Limnoraphis robusta]|uniref:VMAP-C domain-containing protein n=1 Tax=Limnoraphis robusta TaxID=1118279 RepID=UPI002B2186AA|nr:hypothetical protein [Limnoraphis robusta]MEA5500327.1 hypothetical protein [Limnoraphis robusta BA-68 BA1]
MKKRILLFEANPQSTQNLKLNSEIKTIREVLGSAKKPDNFDFKERLATTYEDLQKYLLRENPHILHFCGHGSGEQGLCLLDEREDPFLLQTEVLVNLVKILVEQNQTLECVLLNACHSYIQAKALSQYVNYAVGMCGFIPDDVAITFSRSFYTSLGEGSPIEYAYKHGINAIRGKHSSQFGLIDEYIDMGRGRANQANPSEIHPTPSKYIACLYVNSNSSITNALSISSTPKLLSGTSEDQLIELLKKVKIKILRSTATNVLREAIDHHLEIHGYQEGEQSKLMNILLDTPPHQDQNLPRIIEFVRQLSLDDRIELSIRQELESWLQTEAENLKIKLPSLSESKPSNLSNQVTQSYLMVTLENHPSKNNQFLMNAWLLPDETSPKDLIPLDLDDNKEQKGVECTLNEAPQKLDKFIRLSCSHLNSDDNLYDLVIELFLPWEYLGEQVYRWKIKDDTFGDQVVLSSKYIMVVRSYDRFYDPQLKNELKKKWKDWKDFFTVQRTEKEIVQKFEHLDCINIYTNNDGKKMKLKLEQEKKLGLKVMSLSRSKNAHKELFKVILRSGIPFAIWAGCESLPEQRQKWEEEFNKLLSYNLMMNLNNLFQQIKIQQWEDAYSNEYPKEHLGSYLCFLCDNPERMPRSLGNDQLRPTGQ